MNKKYMLATLVNCWNRLTGRKLSTVYLAVLMLLPGRPKGSKNPNLVQNDLKAPPGYCNSHSQRSELTGIVLATLLICWDRLNGKRLSVFGIFHADA